MIPKQLEKLKFCRIKKGTKKPFEKDWTNKPYTYEDISKFKGENYGVMCGYENLIVIDFDNKELQDTLLPKLPKTFTVQTGGGLLHLYYFSDNTKSFKIFDAEVNTLSDIQGEGKQVVGPNSIHPNGKAYKVIDDSPIVFLNYSEIQAHLLPYDKKAKKKPIFKEPVIDSSDNFIDICKTHVTMEDVLIWIGVDTSKNPTECPFHESKGGQCLGFEKDVAHCFHCDDAWNIFSLVMQWKKCDFAQSLELLADNFGLRDKLDESRESYKKKSKPKEKQEEKENPPLTEEEEKEFKEELKQTYDRILVVLKKYLKLKKEYYPIVAIWIIGTYQMENFETYPYLFINAQKGSGKTRLLKLIEQLAHDGELLASMREAVLFRIATQNKTILIDELEGLDRKENAPLKELLNACYKRGTKVYRMKKQKDEYVIDAFFPFTPIAIANISGTDDVLGDRCITIRLDKSPKSIYSLFLEDFSESEEIMEIRSSLRCRSVGLCRLCSRIYTRKEWNNYIQTTYNSNTNNTTLHTLHTLATPSQRENEATTSVGSVFKRIINTNIRGRSLELVFPLLQTALAIDFKLFGDLLTTLKTLTEKKNDDDITESRDVSLIEFISKMSSEINYDRYRFVYEITDRFRFFMGFRKDREQEDINPKWVGRAIKRLGLIIDRRRLSQGVEVKLNIVKATELLRSLK